VLSANNNAIVKSIRNDPAPHPPSEVNAPMMAAEREEGANADTSFVQACGWVNSEPAMTGEPEPLPALAPVPAPLLPPPPQAVMRQAARQPDTNILAAIFTSNLSKE
jgi:hypothetical protein